MTKPFQLVAGHPVLDLVNTLDWRFRESGPEELLNSYADLVRFCEQSSLLNPRQLRRLRESKKSGQTTLAATKDLREAISQIVYAIMDERTPPPDAIKRFNHHIQRTQQNRALRWSRSRLEPAWPEDQAAQTTQLPLWLLAQAAFELLTGDDSPRIRACANPECRWLFLDTSKNHTRRWCDMAICGNRMKARRFKAQHRA